MAQAQAHPHRLEVSGAYDVDEGAVLYALVIHVFLGHKAPTPVAIERQHVGHAGCFDAGNGADSLQNLLEDGAALRQVVAIVDLDLDGGDVGRLKAKVDVDQA